MPSFGTGLNRSVCNQARAFHMKVFIYRRKSSEQEDRQALSLESQAAELQDLCTALHVEAPDFDFGEAKSAKYPNKRPLFAQMLKEIEKSTEGSKIVVWNADRLSRNSVDTGALIYLLDIEKLTEIVTPSQTFKNTPNDKFLLSLLCSQAKLDNDNKSISVKRGLKTKAEKGHLPSGAKPGYINDKFAEKGNKTIMDDPERFPLIKKAWELMISGLYNPPQVLEKLNNEWGFRTPKHRKIGGNPMSRSAIYKVFSDPFYYGMFEYPEGSGVWYRGKHNPMITKEQFERVQILIGGVNKPKPKTHEFPFTGMMKCGGCGAAVTAEEKWQTKCSSCRHKFSSLNRTECPKCKTKISEMTNPKIGHYIYYHCTKRKDANCSQQWVDATTLEKQINELISTIEIPESFKLWAIKKLNKLNDLEVQSQTSVISSLQNAYKDCLQKLNNLNKLKICPQNSDGTLLTDEEFVSQKLPLMQEKRELEDKMKKEGEQVEKWLELSEKTFNFARYAHTWFKDGDLKTKKAILQGIGSNLILKDKRISLDLLKPFQYIQEKQNAVIMVSERLEPAEESVPITQIMQLYDQNPSLLPRVDSNHEP